MEETDVALGKCPQGHDNAYSYPYDCFFCPTCDEWLEHGGYTFGDTYICPPRPDKPSQISLEISIEKSGESFG